ncbi:hypothetical protein [Microbulbifer sp. TRSA005]|uniref:hypothetical protein n=1 Tax=Microbulbifer sp. TRSA005 TaxID=3243383 RepID=UPI004039A0B4
MHRESFSLGFHDSAATGTGILTAHAHSKRRDTVVNAVAVLVGQVELRGNLVNSGLG